MSIIAPLPVGEDMARSFWPGFSLVAALALAGCTPPPAPVGFTDAAQRDQAMAAFRAGRARLDCTGPACLPAWLGQADPVTRQPNGNRREAAQGALAAQNWSGLAEVVLAAGVESDITWYYLGVAAQGMGLTPAARTYFQASIRRSRDRSGLACGTTIPCDGVALPRTAQAALAAITPRTRVAQPGAGAAAPAEEEPAPQAPSPWVRPVTQ